MGRYQEHDHSEMSATLERSFVTRIRATGEVSKYPFCVRDLFNEEKRDSILREQALQQGLLLRGEGSVAVGTLFAKRYSVLVMAVISAFSLYDTSLSIAEEDIRFELNGEGGMRYETRLARTCMTGSEDPAERGLEISMLRDRLQLHLEYVFQSVAVATGASYKVMSALVAHNVQQLVMRMIDDRRIWKTERRLAQMKVDQSIWLDRSNDNTFAIRLQRFEHSKWQGPPFLIRRYCCLAYQVGSGSHAHGYCNSCPKLDSEARWQNLSQH
ncbi:hypothetical protein C0Q44_12920 [Paenibacillus sp. PCH8]|uniref:(2Fe-2S)-binding protein n=1 Tax=Paenibacillus sp. PCH8 TaxID=2066524 RepID=UPI000CFA6B17|nr:(2Fe-2S)-binding protein [Paenibacillus sp. PCH8]PQP82353.1 hypothetical protein C0Q44_12920 [Paenibacillus sp. PCH8]